MYNSLHQTQSVLDESVDPDRLFGRRELLVVSNRQPYRHESGPTGEGPAVDRPTGGLTASLDPVMQRTGGSWIAWGDGDADRSVVDDSDRVPVPPEDPGYTLRRLWLDDDQVKDYYYGFSNRVLWPLCHAALATVESEHSYWEAYRQTNEQFADAVVEEATHDAVVWFQDYHLALAPRIVRQRLQDETVLMQYWHIPWPAPDIFQACPHVETILSGLLGNDVLGFHVARYRDNFLKTVDDTLEGASINFRSGVVSYRGSETRVVAVPMGVPFDEIRQKAAAQHSTEFRAFRDEYGIDADTKIAVGVERLDYSKGILERLKALEHLWEEYPHWRESLTYVQKATESRTEIPAYQTLQNRVEQSVASLNSQYGTEDWQPVVSVTDHLSRAELFGLYRHADLGIVSSIRDGMNLVALEYAAAQIEGDGVLVLSDQIGAHDLLGGPAISISPFNVEQFATGLLEALKMPRRERRSRMERLRQTVAANDLQRWLEGMAGHPIVRSPTSGHTVQHDKL